MGQNGSSRELWEMSLKVFKPIYIFNGWFYRKYGRHCFLYIYANETANTHSRFYQWQPILAWIKFFRIGNSKITFISCDELIPCSQTHTICEKNPDGAKWPGSHSHIFERFIWNIFNTDINHTECDQLRSQILFEAGDHGPDLSNMFVPLYFHIIYTPFTAYCIPLTMRGVIKAEQRLHVT